MAIENSISPIADRLKKHHRAGAGRTTSPTTTSLARGPSWASRFWCFWTLWNQGVSRNFRPDLRSSFVCYDHVDRDFKWSWISYMTYATGSKTAGVDVFPFSYLGILQLLFDEVFLTHWQFIGNSLKKSLASNRFKPWFLYVSLWFFLVAWPALGILGPWFPPSPTGKAIFWLDPARSHDCNIIAKVVPQEKHGVLLISVVFSRKRRLNMSWKKGVSQVMGVALN